MKKTTLIRIIIAILAVCAAVYVTIWCNHMNAAIDNELGTSRPQVEENYEDIQEDTVEVDTQSVDALQESFDALFSGEDIGEYYEGQTEFGFIEE